MAAECDFDPMDDSKHDMQKLLGTVLPFAKKMLTDHGEFYPFGAVLNSTGSISHVGARIEGAEHPKSADLIALLFDDFREGVRLGKYVATALAFDVKIKPPGGTQKVDAVQVRLDHVCHDPIEVLHPYSIQDGVPVFEDAFSQAGDASIFR
jgi:hypothetical protein